MRTLRIALLSALVAVGVGAMAFGQTSTVYIQNQESSDFHYVLDPKELEGLTSGSSQLATRVAGFFAERSDTPSLALLAAGAEAKLDGLADGSHLLVGFFATGDQTDLPVRVITLQADSRMGERFYAVFASPAQLTVPRGVGRLAQLDAPAADDETEAAAEAPSIVAEAPAAEAPGTAPAAESAPAPGPETVATTEPGQAQLPTLVAFSASYTPESFTREEAGGLTVLPISESQAWNLTGTRIGALGAAWDASGLRLGLTAADGFSESVSYFFYVFAAREPGAANAVTLELEPRARGERGACLLWEKGATSPRIVGTVTTTGTTVEVDIAADELAKDLPSTGGALSVDLTAAWYDEGLGAWEEFYYTTFTSDQITR